MEVRPEPFRVSANLLRGLLVVWLCLGLLSGMGIGQNTTGEIEGLITREDGTPFPGVSVSLIGTPDTAITDTNGYFRLLHVHPGEYALTFILGENSLTRSGVEVRVGESTRVDVQLDWEVPFALEVVVFAASRYPERVVEAPAAVTIVGAEEIERQVSHGQLAKLLEFTPGVQITQGGLYDFNLNTRGFNSSLNRRVAMLIDGRDPSDPFFGVQEWAAVSSPLDDFDQVEFLRGPSAALYGPNASGGVINLTTKPPRFSQGGLIRLTTGQLKTLNLDFRWAGELGSDWYMKATGGIRSSGDFTVSRQQTVPYSVPCQSLGETDCLPLEAVPFAREGDADVYFGSGRLDRYLPGGRVMSLEAGIADIAGPVLQTGIGRVQNVDVKRPWARGSLSSDHWHLSGFYNDRKAESLSLSSGTEVFQNTHNFQIDGQGNWHLAEEQIRIVAGASARIEKIDSQDPVERVQTLLFEAVDSNRQAGFSQVDLRLSDRLKFVLGARWDTSSLHDLEFSPKGGVVFGIDPQNTLRLTYNEAFQVPNYGEFFLQANAAPPVDLSGLNAFCTPFGVDCGFGITPILAVGNEQLDLEKIKTWELGYSGVLRNRLFLSLDYHNSKAKNFITELLPQLGTPLGRINPDFGPWETPAGLPAAVADTIRSTAPPILSNNKDGSNILAAVSYTNFGTVNTQGIDLGINHYFNDHLKLAFNYSWFDFEIDTALPGLDSLLLPNAPENSFGAGFSYTARRWDTQLNFRWVDNLRWSAGVFQGDVLSYSTFDFAAHYSLTEHWKTGLYISNLFDNQHWEAFGGALLRRRMLFDLQFSW